MSSEYILTLSAPDQPGLIHAVSAYLAENNCSIKESSQHVSPQGNTFMRLRFLAGASPHGPTPNGPEAATPGELRLLFNFEQVAGRFNLRWDMRKSSRPPRVLLLVSEQGHCLNRLLFEVENNTLAMEVAGIVSDREKFNSLATWKDLRYHHLPQNEANRAEQEEQIMSIVRVERIDLVVLAAYAPTLSPTLCRELFGHCIGVKVDLVPNFTGPDRYEQAWQHGLRLVSASAYYPLDCLDDGNPARPGQGVILEQRASLAPHSSTPADLAARGREQQCRALSAAVKAHLERRIILDGNRAVVFD